MSKTAVIILIIVGVIVLLGIIVFLFFIFGSGPSFKAGKMKNKKDLQDFLKVPSQSGVKEGYWKVSDEILLYYEKKGTGKNVLVIHGGPGYPYAEEWTGLIPLKEDYSFYYYHQRGCGLSTRPIDKFETKNFYKNMTELNEKLGIEQQIADIEKIRKIIGEEKLIIIGHSFGGFIGTLYAAEFPENVEKLILVDPANMLVFPPKDGGLYKMIDDNLKDEKLKAEFDDYKKRYFNFGKLFEKSEEELVKLNIEIVKYYAAALEAQGKSIQELKSKEGYDNGWMSFGIYMSIGRKNDFRPALKNFNCPTLIIHAEDDFLMNMDAINSYKDNIKGSEVKIIKNAAHHSFMDNPEDFAEIVSKFLK